MRGAGYMTFKRVAAILLGVLIVVVDWKLFGIVCAGLTYPSDTTVILAVFLMGLLMIGNVALAYRIITHFLNRSKAKEAKKDDPLK
jgi:hypothetical protein